MIKILWVSARIFSKEEETQSGVWLKSLANKLSLAEEIMLANVSCKRDISITTTYDYGKIRQWAIPFSHPNKQGLPSLKTDEEFGKIVNLFKPDIIQIWGSENPLKLLPFDSKLPGIKVLTMQGVLESIAPCLLSGLSIGELFSTIGIRELLLRNNLFTEKKSFIEDGKIENMMIRKCNFIIAQSQWTESQIWHINPTAKIYRTNRALRPEFLNCSKWSDFKHTSPIIYSAAKGYSLKGLHILIKALAIIKTKFPDVKLRLAGKIDRRTYLADGYSKLLLRLIKKHDLEKNIVWLGSINAEEIIKNLQDASVFVNPSCVESYSLTFAEAMSVGTPSVVSFAGAMPELADNNKEALFFTPLDYKRCAHLIINLLTDKKLSAEISRNAIIRSDLRNIHFDIVNQQIEIYKDILAQGKLTQ